MKSVAAEARILRDGRQVQAVAAGVAANGDGTSTARGVVPLAMLEPGYYVLQVTVSPGVGAPVTASQWTDFEIAQ